MPRLAANEINLNVSTTDFASCEDTTTEDDFKQPIVDSKLRVIDEAERLSV